MAQNQFVVKMCICEASSCYFAKGEKIMPAISAVGRMKFCVLILGRKKPSSVTDSVKVQSSCFIHKTLYSHCAHKYFFFF